MRLLGLLRTKLGRALLALVVANVISIVGIGLAWPFTAFVYIFVPGLLALYIIDRPKLLGLYPFVLSFGLGLASMIFLGLLVNSFHWLFGVAHPLTLAWLLPVLDVYCLLLTAFIVTKRVLRATDIPTKDLLRHKPGSPFLAIVGVSFVAVTLTYFGVNLLNNTGNNTLVALCNLFACVVPIVAVIFRKRLDGRSYAVLLFTMSYIFLLSSSLRSLSVFGSDIVNEFRVFSLTHNSGLWWPSHSSSTYNLCLSITVLPQMFQQLTSTDGLLVFKSLFPAIFSMCPVIFLVIASRFLVPIRAFLSSLVFLGFSDYINSMPNHSRQEIAFIFFSLIILIMLRAGLHQRTRNVLILMLGSGMVLAHYSTSYVAFMLFIGYLICLKGINYLRVKQAAVQEPYVLGPIVLAVLVLLSIGWYSGLSSSSGGPVSYGKSIISNLKHGDDIKANGANVNQQLSLKTSNNTAQVAAAYLKTDKPGYSAQYIPTALTVNHVGKKLNTILQISTGLLQKTYKFILVACLPYIVVVALRRKQLRTRNDTYVALLCASAGAIVLSLVIPSFSVDYDLERFFQQLLVILPFAFVISWFVVFRRRPVVGLYSLGVFLLLYLVVSTGLASNFTGGNPLSAKFNNTGFDYGRYYVHNGELDAAKWAFQNRSYRGIYADQYGSNRVRVVTDGFEPNVTFDPSKVPKGSFVYFDSANLRANMTYATYAGTTFALTAPGDYYNLQANTLYTNSRAAVYEN